MPSFGSKYTTAGYIMVRPAVKTLSSRGLHCLWFKTSTMVVRYLKTRNRERLARPFDRTRLLAAGHGETTSPDPLWGAQCRGRHSQITQIAFVERNGLVWVAAGLQATFRHDIPDRARVRPAVRRSEREKRRGPGESYSALSSVHQNHWLLMESWQGPPRSPDVRES